MPKLKPLKCSICGRDFLYEGCLDCRSYHMKGCCCNECDGCNLCGKELKLKDVFIFR